MRYSPCIVCMASHACSMQNQDHVHRARGWRHACRTHIVGACRAEGNNAHAAMRCPCAQAEAGKVVMAGAFGETPEGALFIFKDATPEVRRWGHV